MKSTIAACVPALALTALLAAPGAEATEASAHCKKGVILKKKGKYEQALVALDKCLELNPQHHEGWFQKGKVHSKLGQYEKAKTAYFKAIELDDDDSWYHSALCGVLVRMEEIDAAIEMCKLAVELDEDGDNWAAHAHLGVIYRQIRKYEAAVVHYKKAIEIAPDETFLYSNLGVVYRKMKKYADAVAMFQKCIEQSPDQPIYHLNLAIAFRAQEKYELAIAEYIETTALDPTIAEAWWDMALSYQALGKDDNALHALEKYLALVKDKNPIAEEKAKERIDAIKEAK
jgi:tetratricopeptide (TPR) repeat protein